MSNACVPYGDSFAIVGGEDNNYPESTILKYYPDINLFLPMTEQLSEPKYYVSAFAVNEENFPDCQ